MPWISTETRHARRVSSAAFFPPRPSSIFLASPHPCSRHIGTETGNPSRVCRCYGCVAAWQTARVVTGPCSIGEELCCWRGVVGCHERRLRSRCGEERRRTLQVILDHGIDTEEDAKVDAILELLNKFDAGGRSSPASPFPSICAGPDRLILYTAFSGAWRAHWDSDTINNPLGCCQDEPLHSALIDASGVPGTPCDAEGAEAFEDPPGTWQRLESEKHQGNTPIPPPVIAALQSQNLPWFLPSCALVGKCMYVTHTQSCSDRWKLSAKHLPHSCARGYPESAWLHKLSILLFLQVRHFFTTRQRTPQPISPQRPARGSRPSIQTTTEPHSTSTF